MIRVRLVALIGAVVLSQPVLADIFKPSPAQQVKLGQQAAAELRSKQRILPSTDARVRILRQIGNKLIATIPAEEQKKMPWQYSFDVVDDKTVNAFALPGGPVFFYRGIIEKITTEDQLAAVLAHELTHIRKEHWASAYADSQKRQLGIVAVLMLIRANKQIVDVAAISNALLFELPFSRKHESEADNIGYDMMASAGYNPQGMVDVFKMLAQGSSGGPEFLSTHPDAKNRVKKLEERVTKDSRRYPAQRRLRY